MKGLYDFVTANGRTLVSLLILVLMLTLAVFLLWRLGSALRRAQIEANLLLGYDWYRRLMGKPINLSREEDCTAFWLHVVITGILALACVGLAAFVVLCIVKAC